MLNEPARKRLKHSVASPKSLQSWALEPRPLQTLRSDGEKQKSKKRLKVPCQPCKDALT